MARNKHETTELAPDATLSPELAATQKLMATVSRYFVKQVFIFAEAAQPANVHQRIFFRRHGEHVAVGVHLADDLFDGTIRVAPSTLFDKPGDLAEARGVDNHRK